jgi:putative transposase
MLGFEVSEISVSRWMRRPPSRPDPAKRWLAFLRNRRETIAAMDFFAVPTLTFSMLYCIFIISHDRRRILHCNVTRHPTSTWIAQQLREACRRELLDHVIALKERHLKRLLSAYISYYHDDRTHLGLGKRTPAGRLCLTVALLRGHGLGACTTVTTELPDIGHRRVLDLNGMSSFESVHRERSLRSKCL